MKAIGLANRRYEALYQTKNGDKDLKVADHLNNGKFWALRNLATSHRDQRDIGEHDCSN